MARHQPRSVSIDPALFDQVVAGVARGNYHLVLGAGASAGCRNASGHDLLLGRALAGRLLTEVGLLPGTSTLSLAYEEAVATLGHAEVISLLRSIYADAEPLQWHRRIPEVPWEAIWTFNIDDVVEVAYRSSSTPAQYIEVCEWPDRPKPLDGTSNRLPVIHLHGYVGNVEPRATPNLIFGLQEYLTALRAEPGNWQTRFEDAFIDKPMVIIGARLSDEIDFGEIFRGGNAGKDYNRPSLIVLKDASELQRRQYARWGLTYVQADADRFIDYLVDAVRTYTSSSVTTLYSSRYTVQNFQVLPRAAQDDIATSASHDYYGGHEPEWIDILTGLDATPRFVNELLGHIGTPASSTLTQVVIPLVGKPFAGKSTAMLRLGRELQDRGWETTYLAGLDKLDTDESLSYFADRPNAVLLIEDLHYDINDVVDLLAAASAKDQRLIVIGTDRLQFARRINLNLPAKFVLGDRYNWFREPLDGMWTAIVDKRAPRARLGRLDGVNRLVVQRHFLENHRDLYSALASLEDAQGFVARGLEAIHSLNDTYAMAFTAVAITGWLGLPVSASTVAAVSRIDIGDLLTAVRSDGALSSWISLRDGHLRLRHRYLGDIIVRRDSGLVDQQTLLLLAQRICLDLAGSLSVEVIREKKLEARIVGALMDVTTLHLMAPGADLDTWYSPLENAYRWNARFWEQWALAVASTDLDRAYSYAMHAVGILDDSFTRNTLGLVLMKRAERALTKKFPGPWQDYWRDADRELTLSRSKGEGRFEHPYMTFLSHTRRLAVRAQGRDSSWDAEVRESARDWMREVRRNRVLQDPVGKNLIRSLPGSWRDTG